MKLNLVYTALIALGLQLAIVSSHGQFASRTTITGGTYTPGIGDPTFSGSPLSNTASSLTVAGTIAGPASLHVTGSTTLSLSGANTYTGSTLLSLTATLNVTTATLPPSTTVQYDSFGTLVFNQAVNGTASNTITDIAGGFGEVVKNGAGTLTLTAANSYNGTTINSGTLALAGAGTLGNATNSGNVTINAGTLDLGSTNQALQTLTMVTGQIVNGTLTVTGSDTLQSGLVSAALAGGATVTVSGSGPVTLSGANTYTGGTALNAGTAALASAGALGTTGTISFGGGTLQYTAVNTTDYSGRFSNAANQAYNVDTNGQAVSFASALTSNGGSLLKSGNGILTLLGANTYTGGTIITGGTLVTGSANLPTAGGLTISGSTVILNQTTTGTFTGPIANSGQLFVNGTGNTLTLAGAASGLGGSVALNGVTLVVNSSTLPASNGVSLSNSATLVFNQTTTGSAPQITGTGTLLKTGAGELNFSGVPNSFTGSTIIDAGTVGISSSSGLGTFTNSVELNGGALKTLTNSTPSYVITVTAAGGTVDNGGNQFNLAGSNISSIGALSVFIRPAVVNTSVPVPTLSGTLTFTGSGNTTVSAANITGLAGVNINAGTLDVGFNSVTGSSTIANDFTISSTATLAIVPLTVRTTIVTALAVPGGSSPGSPAPNTATTNNATLSGVIAGNGTLLFTGIGTLTLASPANTFTGLLLTNSSLSSIVGSTGTVPGNVSSSGTITFNQSSDGTYAGNITGGGVIVKQGSGTLILTNTTSSPINLLAGSLSLGAEGISGGSGTTTVSSGALFGGNGTITGNLLNGGTVSPGFSPGTINVTGNFTQTASGNLVIQLASATSFDKLAITGSAALAGNLEVDSLGGFVPGGKFVILTAAGGLGGTTFTTTDSLTALTYSVIYDPTDVTLSFSQANLSDFALTPNQFAVATAAQNSPALTAALDAVPTAQLPAAFNAISPQGYEVWSDIAFAHATELAQEMERPSEATDGHNAFYFDTGQNHGREGSTLDVGRSSFTSTDDVVGGDHYVSPALSLGGFFAYGETDSDLSQAGSSTKTKDYTIGARAAWNQGPWYVHGVAAFDFDDYNATRPIVFPGTATSAEARTHGSQWTIGLSGGQHFTVKNWTVSPFASAIASGWQANSFTETGAGAFNLTLANQSATSFRTQFGADVESTLAAGALELHPHVSAAWQHEFEDGPRSINAGFGADTFKVTTVGPQRDSAVLGGGLNVTLTPRAVLYSNFSLQTGSVAKILGGWNVGVSVRF